MLHIFDAVAIVLFFSYIAYRAVVKARVLTDVPKPVGDSVHFGLGLFVGGLDPFHASLVSVLYVAYQLFDWLSSRDTVARDVATFLAGVVARLGGGLIWQ
jgi:hypothetical protein